MTVSELRELAIQSAQTYHQFLADKGKGISSVGIHEVRRVGPDTFHLVLASRLSASAAASLDSLQFRLHEREYNAYQIAPIEYHSSKRILIVRPKPDWVPVLSEVDMPDENAAVFSDLKFLVKRVEEWYTKYGDLIIPPRYLPSASPLPIITSAEVSCEQSTAISGALSFPASYIWGAPGTGKTRVILASCILSLLRDEKRALIAAPTNNALEQMLYGLLPVLSSHGIPLDRVLRLGTPTAQFADQYPQVCESAGASRQLQQLEAELKQIQDCLEYRSDMVKWQNFVRRAAQLCSQLLSAAESFEQECAACEAISLSSVHLRADDTLLRREVVQLIHDLQSTQKKRDALSPLRLLCKKRYSAVCAEESYLASSLQANKEKLDALSVQIKGADLDFSRHENQRREFQELFEAARAQLVQHSSSRQELLHCAESLSIASAPECIHNFQCLLDETEKAAKGKGVAFSAYDNLSNEVLLSRISDISDKRDSLRDFSAEARMQSVSVLALTLDKFISLDLPLDAFVPHHVFIDEAAYCPLIKSAPLLSLNVPVTFLGDHMQLPPVCEIDPRDFKESKYKCCCLWSQSSIYLDSVFTSSFERIWKDFQSSASPSFTHFSKFALTATYRFGTSLSDILARHIYTPDFHSVLQSGTELVILNAPNQAAENRRISSAEVDAVSAYLSTVKPNDYAIITPYRLQRSLLSQRLQAAAREDRILTVHASQGREYDTVIFSVVDRTASNMFYCNTRIAIGKQVVNTAVSRAKRRLVIACDRTFWLSQSHQLISDLIRSASIQ